MQQQRNRARRLVLAKVIRHLVENADSVFASSDSCRRGRRRRRLRLARRRTGRRRRGDTPFLELLAEQHLQELVTQKANLDAAVVELEADIKQAKIEQAEYDEIARLRRLR